LPVSQLLNEFFGDSTLVQQQPEDLLPESWISHLYKRDDLWKDAQLAQVRESLAVPASPSREMVRRRSHSPLLVGAHLENAGSTEWAHGCYLAATAVDPTYDLPWAFLALVVKDPAEGRAYANKALIVNPKSLSGLVNRGTVFLRFGRGEDALRDFAEACRYDSQNPRLLLQCAHAAMEAGLLNLSVRLFLHIQRAFPTVPEAWFGLARLFWRAGLPDMTKLCQEKFRLLRHGNIPKELHLVGRLRVEARQEGIRVQVDQESGKTHWEIAEISTGEHRISWENGPVRKIMIDEGESIKVVWRGGREDVDILNFTSDPTSWKHVQADGSVAFLSSREILAPFIVANVEQLVCDESLGDILSAVSSPLTPFAEEGRLTVEVVFRILLEEILADGILDAAEGELLRAVRDRLPIDPARYEAILDEARRRAAKLAKGKVIGQSKDKAGPLDPKVLYRRLFAKAIEDNVLEDAERVLLQTIAEALLLAGEEVASIEVEIQQSRLRK